MMEMRNCLVVENVEIDLIFNEVKELVVNSRKKVYSYDKIRGRIYRITFK